MIRRTRWTVLIASCVVIALGIYACSAKNVAAPEQQQEGLAKARDAARAKSEKPSKPDAASTPGSSAAQPAAALARVVEEALSSEQTRGLRMNSGGGGGPEGTLNGAGAADAGVAKRARAADGGALAKDKIASGMGRPLAPRPGEELWVIARSPAESQPADPTEPTAPMLRAKRAGVAEEIPLPLAHTDVHGRASPATSPASTSRRSTTTPTPRRSRRSTSSRCRRTPRSTSSS